jgi:8-oxo-dGTP diphosphatase
MQLFGEKIEDVEYFARPGSYALIIEKRRVGVVRSNRSGKYFLVGGGQDAGESETEALRREAREEIGYEIEVLEKIGAAIEYFYAENDRQYVAKECNFYRARLLGKAENTPEGELLWLGAGELGKMFHECHRWIAERELKI